MAARPHNQLLHLQKQIANLERRLSVSPEAAAAAASPRARKNKSPAPSSPRLSKQTPPQASSSQTWAQLSPQADKKKEQEQEKEEKEGGLRSYLAPETESSRDGSGGAVEGSREESDSKGDSGSSPSARCCLAELR